MEWIVAQIIKHRQRFQKFFKFAVFCAIVKDQQESYRLENYRYILQLLTLVMLLVGVSVSVAYADDDEGEERDLPIVSNAKWEAECSDCHLAYPPHFLPAQSWRAVMLGLDKHFGGDASIDATDAKEITEFLEKNADRRRHSSGGKPIVRITDMRWFKLEHDEISERTWKNTKVKSPANCGACHTQVDLGDFSEHNVHIPR